MKEEFRKKKFSVEKMVLLTKVMRVIGKYQQMHITLTLRQLYYQLVAGGIIPNEQKAYAMLSGLITDARYCGIIDWSAIEDRIRKPSIPSTFADVPELIAAAVQSYQLNFWKEQDNYVELYTEKDALSSVLLPIAQKFRIPFSVNRGYSSASAMYDAAQRFMAKEEKTCTLLYLGDHDPSGLDMIRDIKDRLEEFGADVEVVHIALTSAQVKQYNPPPNPAKFSDPRAAWYVSAHGKMSWEVDALPPEDMIKLVQKSILSFIDVDKMKKVLKTEREDIEKLKAYAKTWGHG